MGFEGGTWTQEANPYCETLLWGHPPEYVNAITAVWILFLGAFNLLKGTEANVAIRIGCILIMFNGIGSILNHATLYIGWALFDEYTMIFAVNLFGWLLLDIQLYKYSIIDGVIFKNNTYCYLLISNLIACLMFLCAFLGMIFDTLYHKGRAAISIAFGVPTFVLVVGLVRARFVTYTPTIVDHQFILHDAVSDLDDPRRARSEPNMVRPSTGHNSSKKIATPLKKKASKFGAVSGHHQSGHEAVASNTQENIMGHEIASDVRYSILGDATNLAPTQSLPSADAFHPTSSEPTQGQRRISEIVMEVEQSITGGGGVNFVHQNNPDQPLVSHISPVLEEGPIAMIANKLEGVAQDAQNVIVPGISQASRDQIVNYDKIVHHLTVGVGLLFIALIFWLITENPCTSNPNTWARYAFGHAVWHIFAGYGLCYCLIFIFLYFFVIYFALSRFHTIVQYIIFINALNKDRDPYFKTVKSGFFHYFYEIVPLVRCGKAHYEFFRGTINNLDALKIHPTVHVQEVSDKLKNIAVQAQDEIAKEAHQVLLDMKSDFDEVTRRNTLLNSAEEMKKAQQLELQNTSVSNDQKNKPNPIETPKESSPESEY
ncbi:hypothetical protein RFI_20022 [Reticulomyxa filosa]|uniref:Uncharacterized protein n=1 Tax=Reticulomyxa filosa TaxID=46433 RepID=X6MTY8_RETFI|nr:hypothetical protein RFI_20022 [Reticulomyxa filosa]|eukprot:ETO17304.1 hypothetical protein RFI_20022 [Reticulomyxa filosa]